MRFVRFVRSCRCVSGMVAPVLEWLQCCGRLLVALVFWPTSNCYPMNHCRPLKVNAHSSKTMFKSFNPFAKISLINYIKLQVPRIRSNQSVQHRSVFLILSYKWLCRKRTRYQVPPNSLLNQHVFTSTNQRSCRPCSTTNFKMTRYRFPNNHKAHFPSSLDHHFH